MNYATLDTTDLFSYSRNLDDWTPHGWPTTETDSAASSADLSVGPLADMTRPAPDMTLGCSTALLGGPQFKTPSDACKACAMLKCCNELAACTADTGCVAQRGCFLNCAGNQSCG